MNNAEHSEIQRPLGFEYNGMVLHEYYLGALAAVGVGRSAYLEAYFKNINWVVIEERMKNALTRHSDR